MSGGLGSGVLGVGSWELRGESLRFGHEEDTDAEEESPCDTDANNAAP